MADTAKWLDILNFRIPFGRWQLFEFTSLWIVPPFIKHDQQDALSARWNKRIPILQTQSPAELAADVVNESLESLPDVDTAHWSVLDIGSGNGGPAPVIDMLVNHGRVEDDTKQTIPFKLSDINVNLNMDAWMVHAGRSSTLTFIPQPVDATLAPFSAISTTTAGDKEAAFEAGFESNGNKIFRLFCATFHQFDDETAVKALKNTMETSDAFAIVELQERTVFSLILVFLESCLLIMLMAIFWFWKDPVHLIFTYLLPILPLVQCLDGFVDCLRARTFDETLVLVQRAYERKQDINIGYDGTMARIGHWEFKCTRIVHTWPFGYLTVITGRSCSSS